MRTDDRYGLAFPVTHIGGANNLTAALQGGFSLAISEAFDPPVTVAGFRRQGVTIAGGGPVFYQALLGVQRSEPHHKVLPQLRFLTGGGAPMPPEMHHEVRRELGGAGCAHGYGMTESCMVAANHPDDREEKLSRTSGPAGANRLTCASSARMARTSPRPRRRGPHQGRGRVRRLPRRGGRRCSVG